jgi:hypothetical protein
MIVFSGQLVHTSNMHNHQTRQVNSGHITQPKARTNRLRSKVLYRDIADELFTNPTFSGKKYIYLKEKNQRTSNVKDHMTGQEIESIN